MFKHFSFLFLVLILSSCQNEDFYTEYQTDDLWRLPLLKPYELKNSAGAARDNFYSNNWHLIFKEKQKNMRGLYNDGVNVTKVNIIDSIIFGYGTANPCQHFYLNTKTGEEAIFTTADEWKEFLRQKGIDGNKVFDVFDLFSEFKQKGKLKWRPNNKFE